MTDGVDPSAFGHIRYEVEDGVALLLARGNRGRDGAVVGVAEKRLIVGENGQRDDHQPCAVEPVARRFGHRARLVLSQLTAQQQHAGDHAGQRRQQAQPRYASGRACGLPPRQVNGVGREKLPLHYQR